jgi:hypothetical protein
MMKESPRGQGSGAGGKSVVLWRIVAITALLTPCATLLAACATITKGTTQLVAIDTPGVTGAVCTITTSSGPVTVTTPGTVTLSKGSASLPIQCAKACYVTGTSVIPSDAEAMAAGNVVFGGLIGLGVDTMSGAINKYPDQVAVAMSPDPACQKPPPVSPRPPPRTSNR